MAKMTFDKKFGRLSVKSGSHEYGHVIQLGSFKSPKNVIVDQNL